jgi:adenylate cyclase
MTLVRVFAITGLTLGLLVTAGAATLFQATGGTLLEAAERLRASAARRAEVLVQRELAGASDALADVERELLLGTGSLADPESAERLLLRTLARDPRLAEVTFTAAQRTGFDEQGRALLAAGGRWQVSLFRLGGGDPALRSRRTESSPGGTLARERSVPSGASLPAPLGPPKAVPDPTSHPTFATTASRAFDGRLLWTDLSWAEQDAAAPEAERRVVVSAQKVLTGPGGGFLGVLRVGLLCSSVDALSRLRVDESDPNDPHRVFLADGEGRLLSRLSPGDRLELDDDDLRVLPASLPRPIDAALAAPMLTELSEEVPERSGALEVDGERWLATFRALQGTQGWNVGIVVPEASYTAALRRLRLWFAGGAIAAGLLLALGAAAILAALRRGLGRVQQVAAQLRGLDFGPADSGSVFRDVQEVLEGLERAKTALRALGRYVPVELVRTLVRKNLEPALGGELRELTVFFSDVAGFTEVSERLDPDALARALGLYFAAMTRAITASGGTVDKFIGDAVMALWNAPELREGHAALACAAALECQAAARRLFQSHEWAGLPSLRTRIGLHRAEVMVGHFGSADRLSYTALGDGVNLASRLEGLCKQYGVEVLVSESVEAQVRSAFVLRLVDRVAVKGRSKGVRVYELIAPRSEGLQPPPEVRAYEEAFAAYARGEFAAAAARLERQQQDGPSAVLLRRCREFVLHPPPEGWDGVHVAASK